MGTTHIEWHWRPEPGWLWLSILGMTTGGPVGAAYFTVFTITNFNGGGAVGGGPDATFVGLLGIAVFGFVVGGLVGLAGGFGVGLVLTFLVGRKVPGRRASVLTFVGAATTAAVMTWPVLTQMLNLSAHSDSRVAVFVSASAIIAGLMAMWFRYQLPSRNR